MKGSVLAMDTAIQRTGWCFMKDGKFVEWGSINTTAIKSTSARIAQVGRSFEGLLRIYQPENLVLEDVYMQFDVGVTKQLSRVQGALEYAWWMGKERPAIRLWSSTARVLVGIPGNSQKAEVMLWVDSARQFLKPDQRWTALKALEEVKREKKEGVIKKSAIKSKFQKIAKQITADTSITEDQADAYLLARAFHMITEGQYGKYQD